MIDDAIKDQFIAAAADCAQRAGVEAREGDADAAHIAANAASLLLSSVSIPPELELPPFDRHRPKEAQEES